MPWRSQPGGQAGELYNHCLPAHPGRGGGGGEGGGRGGGGVAGKGFLKFAIIYMQMHFPCTHYQNNVQMAYKRLIS